jgi:hypothetical protein
MGFNDDNEIPAWVSNSGFQVVDSINILGCNITKSIEKLNENFSKTIQKVTAIKRFWERFNLSLPGRIAIAKSLMLAQVSYLGCFISPNKEQLSTLKAIISDFVKGRLNVARDKITLDGKYGGLGMIELDDFITAQQCCWLKRLHNGSPDTYKEIFKILGCDRLDYVDPDSCKIENWPILGGIWQAIRRFYVKFTGTGNNWERLPVLFNPLIKMDRGGKLLCNKFFLHNRPVIGADIAATITGSILWDGERVKSLDDINLLLPVQLSLA